MSKVKSSTLSSFGKVFEAVRLIINAVLELGGSDDDLDKIRSVPELPGRIARTILEAAPSWSHGQYEAELWVWRMLTIEERADLIDWFLRGRCTPEGLREAAEDASGASAPYGLTVGSIRNALQENPRLVETINRVDIIKNGK